MPVIAVPTASYTTPRDTTPSCDSGY